MTRVRLNLGRAPLTPSLRTASVSSSDALRRLRQRSPADHRVLSIALPPEPLSSRAAVGMSKAGCLRGEKRRPTFVLPYRHRQRRRSERHSAKVSTGSDSAALGRSTDPRSGDSPVADQESGTAAVLQ